MIENPQRPVLKQDIHRTQLQPVVQTYCDNIRIQVGQQIEETGFKSMQDFLNGASSADLVRVNQLMTSLETATKTNELPFNNEEYFKALDNIAAEFDVMDTMDFDPRMFDRPIARIDDLKEKIAKIPSPPGLVLQADPRFYESTLRYLLPKLPRNFENGGIILGLISHKHMAELSEDEKDRIRQEIDLTLTPGMNNIGYRHSGGQLVVKGELGEKFGAGMEAGYLEADIVGHHSGVGMQGGKLKIAEAGKYLGHYMAGGEIEVGNCSGYAGAYMSDGAIIITGQGGPQIGERMAGGYIKAQKIGVGGGESMTGGTIEVEQADALLGFNMKDGLIQVGQAGPELGRQMTGGTIVAEQASELLGTQMKGGLIQVNVATSSVGLESEGGKIEIIDSYGALAPKRFRKGEIYFKGELVND